jgi:penicillin-binding protein 2
MGGPPVRESQREVSPLLQRRLVAAVWAVLAGVVLIGMRLWYLQLEQGDAMRTLSENNRVRLRRVAAERGVITDRRGVVLADTRPSFDVVLVPEDARDVAAVLAQLRAYLSDGAPLDPSPQSRKRAPYEGVVLRRDVGWPLVALIESHQLDLPGITLEVAPRRHYPFGSLAAHVLGYVGEVTSDDLARRRELRMGEAIGKAGVERVFDHDLRGVSGGQQIEVDALGRRVRVLDEVPEAPGNSLTLTIDHEVQEAAEAALGKYRGAIIALDPNTGEVLALASRPAFDPNVFAGGVTQEEWRRLSTDPYRPLSNRATQGQYPPGSTFKIVTGAAGLEKGAITPTASICCGGGLQFGNHYFRCWRKQGHGCLPFHWGLVQSCDVYYYQLGQRLGVDAIAEYSRRFGLGSVSGLGLGGEQPGLVPDSRWKRERFGQPWYPGETLSVAIGQGAVLATPVQMATLTAMVANGGTRYRPFVVKRIEAPDATSKEFVPQVLGTLDVKESTLAALRDALRDVVMSDRGTGARARIAGTEVAGKTGTAQAVGEGKAHLRTEHAPEGLRDHAWFVAFAPVAAPTIAVAVLVEHAGHHGGTVAAPMARAVIERHLGRAPDDDAVRQAAHRPL